MSGITLTSSIRTNLSSLRMISSQMGKTQERLSTGLKVNSAIDNANSYYQARSLTNRAADLEALLDAMGQGIQTIEAANSGIDHATFFLEQMATTAAQGLSEASLIPHQVEIEYDTDVQALLNQGYKEVNSSTTATELQALLDTDNAKVVLTEDVKFGQTLYAHGKNIVINGGGHKITTSSFINYGADTTYENIHFEVNKSSSLTRGFYSSGANTTVRNVEVTMNEQNGVAYGLELRSSGHTVENVKINMNGSGAQLIGIHVDSKAKVDNVELSLKGGSDSFMAAAASAAANNQFSNLGITVKGGRAAYGILGNISGFNTQTIGGSGTKWSNLYDGQANTEAIVKELGTKGMAAYAASQFCAPGVSEGEAGFSGWYLPSIGELMNVYGYNPDNVYGGTWSNSGAKNDNKKLIDDTLAKLGGDAAQLTNGYYWSSSEGDDGDSWLLRMGNGDRNGSSKSHNHYVRVFQHLENCFYPFNSSEAASGSEGTGGLSAPKIGDVMYSDKSYGSADDYAAAKAAGKIAIGVITEVNNDNGSVKIMNLKDLAFSSQNSNDNFFDPAHPYEGAYSTTRWSSQYSDVKGIDNMGDWELATMVNPSMQAVSIETVNASFADVAADDYQIQYNAVLDEYDTLIADSSYQGVNLLKGGKANVIFNETRSNKFTVQGRDMSSAALGLNPAEWKKDIDIAATIDEIKGAIVSLRSFAEELGTNYSIVRTRQNFTGALIDVLETGADNLTLADMNEESANYLALQTRQQLAINSLSLAAQSAQSILSLF